MSDRYNGWRNYETWRVNLEMFDGITAEDVLGDWSFVDDKEAVTARLADVLEDMATEYVRNDCPQEQGFAYDLAMSFLNKVDFEEIAEHLVEDLHFEELEQEA
jgi:hypothetical protein